MTNQHEIIQFCDDLLHPGEYRDYCPNGLQIEGNKQEIKKIALAVSLTEEVVKIAVQAKAEMILTHHGLLWDKQERPIRGAMRTKLALLLNSGIAAVAYHLPLDFHEGIGNNRQLADRIGLNKTATMRSKHNDVPFGVIGRGNFESADSLAATIETLLGRKPLVLSFGKRQIATVGICSGGGQSYFPEAIEAGVDCYITGEASEVNFSQSQESGVTFIAAGHYATEIFGIQALGAKLAETFNLTTLFIKQDNPI